MGVKKFCALLHEAKFGKNDKTWFPRWIRRYASSVKTSHGDLPVTEAAVVQFFRSLLHNGTPAWQWLQAVRAVEAYRDLVLKTDEPSLGEMRLALGRLAERERAFGTGLADRPGVEDERHLIGKMDPGSRPSSSRCLTKGRSWFVRGRETRTESRCCRSEAVRLYGSRSNRSGVCTSAIWRPGLARCICHTLWKRFARDEQTRLGRSESSRCVELDRKSGTVS